jgi:hypothetical protein
MEDTTPVRAAAVSDTGLVDLTQVGAMTAFERRWKRVADLVIFIPLGLLAGVAVMFR